jgi:hypothetical protein
MPASKPTVPAALAGLVTMFRDAPGLEGAVIFDGPVVSESKAPAAIAVGFTGERMSRTGAYPEPGTPAVDYDAAVDGLVTAPQAETYTIRNLLAVLNGSGNAAAARERAYELLAECGQVIAGDKTLGGAVAMAHMGTHTLDQEQGPRGAVATIVFEVAVSGWTR